MYLSKIRIQNYRAIIDAELDVDSKTTLIVGRNNTAKTSCVDCISTVLNGRDFSYDDYPLEKRESLYVLIERFMKHDIDYSQFCEQLPTISIEFSVDYFAETQDDKLGALSPFIIDVDTDTTEALIRVEYREKMDEKSLYALFEPCFNWKSAKPMDIEVAHDTMISNFKRIFGTTIYAINPIDCNDKQMKSFKELSDLFPFCSIPAERTLGEDGSPNNNTLGKLISEYFEVSEDELDSKIADEVLKLRKKVEQANKSIQKNSDKALGAIVNKAIGFGYPNGEELQLGVITQLKIDEQIKNGTVLSYTSSKSKECLPSTHNGLGYKNLIKMEFLLAAFAKDVEKYGEACIPLLFIEEPESHMHPQMQHTFAEYIETFLNNISDVSIQTFLTSHSAHIANTMDFSKIRYAQKTTDGIIYKNLDSFAQNCEDNLDFIKKYLTLSRCDLFFADKVIFVEGASERLLLPDMIEKCDKAGVFSSQKYALPAQYYALIEIGGAYAYMFIPFVIFLGIPCLILTDIDSIDAERKRTYVSKGKSTSNSTIKYWIKKVKSLSDDEKIDLQDVIKLTKGEKTDGKIHIEFQTKENKLCGRSLEEAIMNVNRDYYKLKEPVTEESLKFDGNSKTDFALKLICDNPDYIIPKYIKDGLIWLNKQKVLE